mgnify:CR=1 FL=1
MIVIREVSPLLPEAACLLDELSAELERNTGRDGRGSFSLTDVMSPRSVFVVAYDGETPVGCGALRPVNDNICEVKRM